MTTLETKCLNFEVITGASNFMTFLLQFIDYRILFKSFFYDWLWFICLLNGISTSYELFEAKIEFINVSYQSSLYFQCSIAIIYITHPFFNNYFFSII